MSVENYKTQKLWFPQESVSTFNIISNIHIDMKKAIKNSVSSVSQSCPTLWIPWTAACQASLFITNTQSLLKLISIESVMASNHLILCHPLLLPSVFPSIRVFSSDSTLHIRWPNTGASASASVLPMNIQHWFPLGLTGLILQSKGLSRAFSSTTDQRHQYYSAIRKNF